MKRLGRFVAIAGRNGAGKSRLLNALERALADRSNALSQMSSHQNNIKVYNDALTVNPNSPDAGQWKRIIADSEMQIRRVTEVVACDPKLGRVQAIRFVPKQLGLEDPRVSPRGQVAAKSTNAKSPGLNGYNSHCLYYIQYVQERWWNATHQGYSGSEESKAEAVSSFDALQDVIIRLFGTELGRNIDGESMLFGKPIADAGLSDGQSVILQFAVALHAQNGSLENSVFLLDEPENHLHPSAVVDVVKAIYSATSFSQIWIATHSVPLLAYVASVDPMSLWYMSDGHVTHAGRHPATVLTSLLGDDDGISQLHAFTGLPAQLAAVNYAIESLFPPKVVIGGGVDPQVNQIHGILDSLLDDGPTKVIDIGAGKGRLLDGLTVAVAERGERLADRLDYYAYDAFPDDKAICESVISAHYGVGSNRYFSTPDELFSVKDERSFSLVVLCNVLHEIPPEEWKEFFRADL
ncbi:AAA family ATPase [Cupriavidus basilensis]